MGSEACLLWMFDEVVRYSYALGYRNALTWASVLSRSEIQASLDAIERQTQ